METENRARILLADSLTVPGAFVLGRTDARGKLVASELLTRADLQAIVQQAHDEHGIVADPFATPGSADGVELSPAAMAGLAGAVAKLATLPKCGVA